MNPVAAAVRDQVVEYVILRLPMEPLVRDPFEGRVINPDVPDDGMLDVPEGQSTMEP